MARMRKKSDAHTHRERARGRDREIEKKCQNKRVQNESFNFDLNSLQRT